MLSLYQEDSWLASIALYDSQRVYNGKPHVYLILALISVAITNFNSFLLDKASGEMSGETEIFLTSRWPQK